MRLRILDMFLLAAFVLALAMPAVSRAYTVNQAQENFAAEVKSLPNVIQASWQSPLDLWVYADGVDAAEARSIAEQVIILARTNLGQSLCVHVHNGDYNPLATKCWSSL
ncbi:MAG: hypothetical protein IT344_00295 [Candidatus Dadabacteria bacterium]|nr:hypothetical protein [Candidatus Dadabacteria bacterium]